MKARHILLYIMAAFAAQAAYAQQLVVATTGGTQNASDMKEKPYTLFGSGNGMTVTALTDETLPFIMAKDTRVSLFYKALTATHLDDSLRAYRDETYYCSPDSTENGRCYPTPTEYDNVFYPAERLYGYTGFVETDDVFAAQGINSLDDLRAYAKKVYDDMYPQDAAITDETDPRNSLNRFVAYHFLPEAMQYDQLTVNDDMLKNFDRTHWDVADWYETMMPHSLMKISYPSGSQVGRYVNRRGVQSRPDMYGVFVPGAKIQLPDDGGANHLAVNGVYHYIDSIIDYGRQTQEVVLNERIRIDATTLSPDFINSGARGHADVNGNPYGSYTYSANPSTNPNTCLGFKAGSAENFFFNDEQTHLHVRNRYLSFWSYQGDEVAVIGPYDFSVKLPPLPEGTYELRLGIVINFQSRGVVQFFFDDRTCGLPRDLRLSPTHGSVGWVADGTNAEVNLENDHMMRLGGWMKGPAAYIPSGAHSPNNAMRTLSTCVRMIITTFHSDGVTDHYLRMEQQLGNPNGGMAFDYIELVPVSVYDNPSYPEDIY